MLLRVYQMESFNTLPIISNFIALKCYHLLDLTKYCLLYGVCWQVCAFLALLPVCDSEITGGPAETSKNMQDESYC